MGAVKYILQFVFISSSIYPLNGFFFLIKIWDLSKAYKPESKIVLDIPTALTFLACDQDFTVQMVGDKVRNLVAEWNKVYEGLKGVSFFLYLFFVIKKCVIIYKLFKLYVYF